MHQGGPCSPPFQHNPQGRDLPSKHPALSLPPEQALKAEKNHKSSLAPSVSNTHTASHQMPLCASSPKLTCSACSSARWHNTTAKDSVLFCCTPTFTASRLFMLSKVWACWSAMVLVQEKYLLVFKQQTTTIFKLWSCYDNSLHCLVKSGAWGEGKLVKQLLSKDSGLCRHRLEAAHSLSTEILKVGAQEQFMIYLLLLNGNSISSSVWVLREHKRMEIIALSLYWITVWLLHFSALERHRHLLHPYKCIMC